MHQGTEHIEKGAVPPGTRARRITRRASVVIAGAAIAAAAVPLGAPGAGASSTPSWVTNLAIPVIYNGVSCANSSDCWIVGSNAGAAVIEATVNGAQSWSTQQAPSGLASLSTIDCVSATQCYAAGVTPSNAAELVATSNAGTTWSAQSLPSGVSAVLSISCPSTSRCTAAVRGTSPLIATTNAGATWSSIHAPMSMAVSLVSCASTAHCVVAGNAASSSGSTSGSPPAPAIALTNDGGNTWTSASVPGSIAGILGLSCGSTSACVAVGSHGTGQSAQAAAIYSANGGSSWSAPSSLPQPATGLSGTITAVACASATLCIASGNNMQYVTTNGGTGWSAATSNPWGDAPLNAASCGSTSLCLSVGGDQTGPAAIASRDGGHSWSFSMGGLTPGVGTVTCPVASSCYALASSGGALVSSNGGVSWNRSALPSSVNGIDAVSCGTSSRCVGVGQTAAAGDQGEAILTANGGASWSTSSIPSGYYSLQGVSCPTSTLCTSVGGYFNLPNIAFPTGNGIALYSTDGGATWTVGTLPSSTGTLLGVACPSQSFCMAVGTSQRGGAVVAISTNAGKSWTNASAPSGTGNLSAVACPTKTTCTAVGGTAIEVTSDSGSSWTKESGPSGDVWDFVSCATSTSCVITGAQSSGPGSQPSGSALAQTSNGGTSWTGVSVPSSFKGLIGASCPTTTECFAVGFGGILSMGAGSGAGPTTTSPTTAPPTTVAPTTSTTVPGPTTTTPISTTTTTTPPASGSAALTGKYLMAFAACDFAKYDCSSMNFPNYEMSYLAQSSDGIHWTPSSSLGSGEFTPVRNAVPRVVTRGSEVYLFGQDVSNGNQIEVTIYSAITGAVLNQQHITLKGFTDFGPSNIFAVDPDPVVTPSGDIVLFFTDSKPGCNSGTVPSTSNCISSASEVSGSDGTRFTVDPGDRIVSPAAQASGHGFLSITDASVFARGSSWVALVSSHNGTGSVVAYTATSLQGSYSPAGTLAANQGRASGYFDAATSTYWTYMSTPGLPTASTVSSFTLERAAASSLSADLGSGAYTTTATARGLGLSSSTWLDSADVRLNTATTAR